MSIIINLEIGHDASLRTKITPEGFTHDWEVYVKGCNGADIHYYVEKVVFHLHETFPKPKRVVKEPPYSLRTSGYAGFNLPIEIYLRNNQEPKKIKFNYDLALQPRGPPIHNVQKEVYIFQSPSEDFRSKLLKGGGIVSSVASAQDINDSKAVDEKNQMTSKPKLSGSDVPKKHKIKVEEPRNTDFLNLFGTPITKTAPKVPEPSKPKETPKNVSKLDKPTDKDKSKTKSPHKDKEKPKDKDKSDSSDKKKDERKKSKEDKSKDRDRVKEKSSKKDKEREKSPPSSRPRSVSPKRSPKRPPSPPPQKHSSSKEKERDQSKDERKEKERKDEKKNKKEKREHKESKHKDRDKEHKEHKSRDSKSSKDSSSSSTKEKEISPVPVNTAPPPQPQQKNDKKDKPKDALKEPKDEEKQEKPRSDRSEDKQKHKHKKKDRKEKRDEKYSSKSEKRPEKTASLTPAIKEEPREAAPVSSTRDVDKSNLFGSPKSEPPSTPSQTDSKEKIINNMTFKDEEASNDSMKVSSRESSPQPRVICKSPVEQPTEPPRKAESERKKEESPKKKEKKEKRKEKKSDRDHEKRKKRKSSPAHTDVEQPPEKMLKEEENNNSDDERKVSSTEDAKPLPTNEAEDYMGMLRDLQHKIMGLTDNSNLQKVVQLIAETGRYEVSAHTFDFDLCLLDRSTVRQLQDFFASIS